MEEAVEHGGDGPAVAEQQSPVLDRSVRSHQRARAFVTAHDDLQQVFCRSGRKLTHSQVIDDQQGHGGQQFHVLFAFSVDGRFGDFLEQDVCLTVDHVELLISAAQEGEKRENNLGADEPEIHG